MGIWWRETVKLHNKMSRHTETGKFHKQNIKTHRRKCNYCYLPLCCGWRWRGSWNLHHRRSPWPISCYLRVWSQRKGVDIPHVEPLSPELGKLLQDSQAQRDWQSSSESPGRPQRLLEHQALYPSHWDESMDWCLRCREVEPCNEVHCHLLG